MSELGSLTTITNSISALETIYATLFALSAIFSADPKLASHTADLLSEALTHFPEDSSIVSWCSYALLHLCSSGCGGVVSDTLRDRQQLLSYCQSPPVCLTDKARGYLMQLEGKLR